MGIWIRRPVPTTESLAAPTHQQRTLRSEEDVGRVWCEPAMMLGDGVREFDGEPRYGGSWGGVQALDVCCEWVGPGVDESLVGMATPRSTSLPRQRS